MKVPEKLSVVLSQTEVTALFGYIGILKHRAVLMLCYGSGLRISEAVSLKAGHLDSSRMLIHVEKGKGAKDRYTVLSHALLKLLRQYWKIQRPKDYLFPGSHPGTHVQPGTIQEICRDACRMAGIEKRVTPHTLRHYAASGTMPRVSKRDGKVLTGRFRLRAPLSVNRAVLEQRFSKISIGAVTEQPAPKSRSTTLAGTVLIDQKPVLPVGVLNDLN